MLKDLQIKVRCVFAQPGEQHLVHIWYDEQYKVKTITSTCGPGGSLFDNTCECLVRPILLNIKRDKFYTGCNPFTQAMVHGEAFDLMDGRTDEPEVYMKIRRQVVNTRSDRILQSNYVQPQSLWMAWPRLYARAVKEIVNDSQYDIHFDRVVVKHQSDHRIDIDGTAHGTNLRMRDITVRELRKYFRKRGFLDLADLADFMFTHRAYREWKEIGTAGLILKYVE